MRLLALRSFFVFTLLACWAGVSYFDAQVRPGVTTHDAVAALNGGSPAQQDLREHDQIAEAITIGAAVWSIIAIGWLALSFYPARWCVALPSRSSALIVGCGLLTMTQAGCYKSYDVPEYADVDTAETAFVVPLEGDSSDQAKFQSEAFLEAHKVAAKRVQIVHRWNQTGRLYGSGEWIASVRLIKVNRSPITREWTADSNNGTSKKDQAIWIESADSVGFSIGFEATAHITEDDAARFLYWYPAGSLADVMDHEVRGRVQQVAAEVAAKYPLDDLRGKKQEIADTVRKDATTFFQSRGITVTSIGMFGGMTYENPKIQQAIDEVFIAQQLKDVALAKFEAQSKQNEQLQLEAEGLAKKAQTTATAEASARITAAEADAKAIQTVNAALQNANPQLLALRQLELEKDRIGRWNGAYPTYYFGTGNATASSLMLQVPQPPIDHK